MKQMKLKKKLKCSTSKKLKSLIFKNTKLEKEIVDLKYQIKDLNSKISMKNMHPIKTMDKRDPLFITLNTQTLGYLPKSKCVMSKNDSYKGNLNLSQP